MDSKQILILNFKIFTNVFEIKSALIENMTHRSLN